MDVFRTPDERFEGLPGYDFAPQLRGGPTACACTTSRGPPGVTVVCFHGEPTWAYLYRKMLARWSTAGNRVMCPDLAGFGRSDKPTDRGWYTYDRHVDFVAGWLERLDLADATVVVQDWGGPIGLRWAVENADRVGALRDPQHRPLHRARDQGLHGVARVRRDERRTCRSGAWSMARTTTRADRRGRGGLQGAVPDTRVQGGRGAFPLLVPITDDPGADRDVGRRGRLSQLGEACARRVLGRGPVFPLPEVRQAVRRADPEREEQVQIEGAAHFLQEDRGEEIGAGSSRPSAGPAV